LIHLGQCAAPQHGVSRGDKKASEALTHSATNESSVPCLPRVATIKKKIVEIKNKPAVLSLFEAQEYISVS
jgi:hypothetical protein